MLEAWTISGFFLLGLLVGFSHCVGMCCPFVLWISGAQRDRSCGLLARLLPHLLYGLGRSLTYAGLGALAGLLGSMVELAGGLLGVQQATAVSVGVLLVLWAGLALVGMLPLARLESLRFVDRWVSALLSKSPRRPLLIGLVLGLLPCGPLYAALIAAAGLESVWQAGLALGLFGLGTLPAMLGLGLVGNLLVRHRRWLHGLSLVVVLAMGFWFVWQGIQL